MLNLVKCVTSDQWPCIKDSPCNAGPASRPYDVFNYCFCLIRSSQGGCYTVYFEERAISFCLQLHDRLQSACRLCLLVSCLAYSSTFKTEAICSSVMSGFLRTTLFYKFLSGSLCSYVCCGSQLRHESANEYRKLRYRLPPSIPVFGNKEWCWAPASGTYSAHFWP